MVRHLWVMLGTIGALLASSACYAGQQEIHYSLGDNEYLFVGGRQFSELVFATNAAGDEIYINGTLVYKYNKPTREKMPMSWPEGLRDSDQVKTLISGGAAESGAVGYYKNLIEGFRDLVDATMLDVFNKRISLEEGIAKVESWSNEPLHGGLIEDFRMTKNSYRWHQAAGGEAVATLVVADDRTQANGPRALGGFASGYLDSFSSYDGLQLMLVSNTGIRSVNGPIVKAMLLQIENIKRNGAYTEGPLRQSDAVDYGVLKEGSQ